MICPKCQTPNRANAKFCDNCGYELPSIAPVAHEIFDEEPKSCKPKMAPTADLNGIDNYNDSSFAEEKSDITEELPTSQDKSEEDYPTEVIESPDDDVTEVIDMQGCGENSPSSDDPDITKVMKSIEGSEKNNANNSQRVYSAQEEKATKRKNLDPRLKKNILIAIGTILVVGAILAITYACQLWGGKVVPDVMGLSENEAREKILSSGFDVETENIASDDIEGIVIKQNPDRGGRAREGSKIMLSISIKRVIPELVGLDKKSAEDLMKKNGFTNFDFVTVKSDEEKDTIVGVTPDVGTRSKADAKVTIQLAEPYTVPNVEGLNQAEAKLAIENAGFKCAIKTQYNEQVSEGTVLSTDPAKDSALKSGSTVTIIVAEKKSTKLEALVRSFFSETNKFTINGKKYELGGVQGVQYTSGNTVAFTITARQFDTATWFGQSETRYLEYETIQGSISFDDNGNIVATSPTMKQGV